MVSYLYSWRRGSEGFELPVQAQSIQAVGGDGLYAVTASVDANFSDYYKMSDEEKAKVHDAYEYKEKDYHVLDETMYWQNGAVLRISSETLFLFMTV